MKNKITDIKKKLEDAISQLEQNLRTFSQQPGKDFTRSRKLPFRKMIAILLSMQGGTLATELLNYFGCASDTPSPSAFVQQRSKIHWNALQFLFNSFIDQTDLHQSYKGFRLLAADSSMFQIPTNPKDTDSFFPGSKGQASYNLLHLDAIYDLLQHTYVAANLVGQKKGNERKALCSLVDHSPIDRALLIADRGYEGFNLMAHIQEKDWKFLIRIQDIRCSRNIASGFNFPDSDEFDLFLDLSLTTKRSNAVKAFCKDKNKYHILASSTTFDYLPKNNQAEASALFYKLPFRIVRFKINDNTFETVVTNLDADVFPPHELKKLYAMRWGIETAFRDLKHTLGLLHFHAKKVEYICQEVFARLIMYNFSELVTFHIIIQNANKKYAYRANFSVAVHICRLFFLGNVSPPCVEALISRHISPLRPGRSSPRKMTVKHTVSFLYRVT